MLFYVKHFKWLMLLSGLLTCTMLQGLLSPDSLVRSNFGVTLDGQPAEIIIRNWSALIGLMGIMLIYGAFVPSVRKYSLIIAGISKIIFILLILTQGKQFMDYGAGIAVIADSIMVLLYLLYLLSARGK